MTRRYQIRDQDFGLAIYEADFAAEALAAFLADKLRAALEPVDYRSTTSETEQRPSCGGASSTGPTRQCPPPNRRDWHGPGRAVPLVFESIRASLAVASAKPTKTLNAPKSANFGGPELVVTLISNGTRLQVDQALAQGPQAKKG